MKTIRIIKPETDAHRFPEDIERIIAAFKAEAIHINAAEADEMWDMHSESMCAGWLHLPATDSDIVYILRPYFMEIP